MLKYIWREKKNVIILVTVVIICSIAIALGIYAQVTNTKISQTKEEIQEKNYIDLKNNFKSIFTNTINRESTASTDKSDEELVYLAYDIQEKNSGKYDINAKIPLFKLENDETTAINKEIMNTFGAKLIDIIKNSTTNTIYSIDYVVYINQNIISLVIRGTLKDGSNPQRIMMQTYNYNLETNKLETIDDILTFKNLSEDTVQNKINEEIKQICEQKSNIETQGYNIYKRDKNDSMYKLQNTTTFFLGQDGNLYVVYAYGNKNYTSEIDLVIF